MHRRRRLRTRACVQAFRQTGAVAEDWRVTVTLEEPGQVEPLLKQLHEHPLEDQLAPGVAGRIAVSSDENKVFLYADTRWTAEGAERVVMEVAAARGLHAEDRLDRWHPVEERWEDAGVPLPTDDEDLQRERERLDAEETAESQASGFASWEVRIEFSSHRDASKFANSAEAGGSADRPALEVRDPRGERRGRRARPRRPAPGRASRRRDDPRRAGDGHRLGVARRPALRRVRRLELLALNAPAGRRATTPSRRRRSPRASAPRSRAAGAQECRSTVRATRRPRTTTG